ncbi:hypothetical protein B0H14DRAFT_2633143 [Mycena olivaceomarginata]|nr:hypothetical protein B0H14DRAFT_2633143 [Mycena olivaceomarginata]
MDSASGITFRLDLYGAVSLGLAAVLAYPEDLNHDLPYGNEPGLPIIVKHVLNYELGKELQDVPVERHPTFAGAAGLCCGRMLMPRWHHTSLYKRSFKNVGLLVDPAWYQFDIVKRVRVKEGSTLRKEVWKATMPLVVRRRNIHGTSIELSICCVSSGLPGNASKAHVTNSLRADRELVTGLSPATLHFGFETKHMGDTENLATALGLAKYKSQAHRRFCRRISLEAGLDTISLVILISCTLRNEEEELREKARIRMAAYEAVALIVHTCSVYLGIGSGSRRIPATKKVERNVLAKLTASIVKNMLNISRGSSAYAAKSKAQEQSSQSSIREQNTREAKAAAIEKEMAATQARRKQERGPCPAHEAQETEAARIAPWLLVNLDNQVLCRTVNEQRIFGQRISPSTLGAPNAELELLVLQIYLLLGVSACKECYAQPPVPPACPPPPK